MRPFFIIQKYKQRNVVRGARGVGRETRAATLQLRAVVLRHAPAWVVGDRNGHNKNRIDDADARGRRCGVAAWLSLPIWHLEYRYYQIPGNTAGITG